MQKAIFNWSSGKDSSYALLKTQQDSSFSVERLLTSINSENDRISMHGLRKELLIRQTDSIGIPLDILEIPPSMDMKNYNALMFDKMTSLKNEGFETSVFGDIFLEDLRDYRENQLNKVGMKAEFPLWKKDTTQLIHDFIEVGFKTIIVAINGNKLDKSFCGRIIDKDFLKDLPKDVDPCGENGEFHTFCFDGPIFSSPVEFSKGEIVGKKYDNPDGGKVGYWFLDLV